ncbi:MAG TPA: polyphosphate kinase 2 family protein [Pyrinomonadaceae bacterium]|jgi:PPK2 family polyphosphate:nucleotide phosphotransferase|nr:polyphosphate kinase 2 family protein [Pyrinomonadaceae bacterium]
MNQENFIVTPDKKFRLANHDPAFTGKFKDKEEATQKLEKDILRLAKYQDALYAENRRALLIILQAMDAAGKDGVIKHVMSGVNPQGTQVFSFKAPSPEELDHDYLWRCAKAVPERGRIGIFNRSYYEEVLVVRVHPELLEVQQLPVETKKKSIWKQRFREINNFERHLTDNGIHVLKFFLHLSKEEQKRRFLARIETPEKNWKFSLGDAKERGFWDEYMNAYEDMLRHTSTEHAPWHVIPADNKWFTRAAIADILVAKLKSLKLTYPTVSDEHRQELLNAKELLEQET